MDTFWDEADGVSPEAADSMMESSPRPNEGGQRTYGQLDSRSSKRDSSISMSCQISSKEKMANEGESSSLVDMLDVFDEDPLDELMQSLVDGDRCGERFGCR